MRRSRASRADSDAARSKGPGIASSATPLPPPPPPGASRRPARFGRRARFAALSSVASGPGEGGAGAAALAGGSCATGELRISLAGRLREGAGEPRALCAPNTKQRSLTVLEEAGGGSVRAGSRRRAANKRTAPGQLSFAANGDGLRGPPRTHHERTWGHGGGEGSARGRLDWACGRRDAREPGLEEAEAVFVQVDLGRIHGGKHGAHEGGRSRCLQGADVADEGSASGRKNPQSAGTDAWEATSPITARTPVCPRGRCETYLWHSPRGRSRCRARWTPLRYDGEPGAGGRVGGGFRAARCSFA